MFLFWLLINRVYNCKINITYLIVHSSKYNINIVLHKCILQLRIMSWRSRDRWLGIVLSSIPSKGESHWPVTKK